MATISIRGKEKLIAHFKNVGDPFWKLYNASDTKSPIQVCTHVKEVGKSLEYLNDILEALDPNGTYILDTFSKSEDKEPQRFLKANTSMCFALSDNPISAAIPEKRDINSSPASLKDQIELIKDNAKLSMECTLYKERYDEAIKRIAALELENEELEDLLQEYEDEEEEEEKSVSGTETKPKNMEEAIAQLIKENGGTIIENLMSKGVKGDVKFNSEEEKEEGEIKVNGIGDDISLSEIIDELMKHDSQFKNHMHKLLLIAQQKPNTFKTFLKKLEEY